MKQLLIFICLILLSFGIDLHTVDPQSLHQEDITVTVTGEVTESGPVHLNAYSTMEDLLKEIEPTDNADLDTFNPNTILKDHDMVVIPTKKEEGELPRISINASDRDQLTVLPGIGPGIAERIVSYRDQHGLFQQLEDLMNVPGIGQAKYDAIADQITL